MSSLIRHALVVVCSLCLAIPVMASEQDELRQQAKALIQKAEELAKKGRADEAEDLERGAKKLLQAALDLEKDQADRPKKRKDGEKKKPNPEKLPVKVPQFPDKTAEKIPEKIPVKYPEKVPEKVAEKIPVKVPEKIPEKVADKFAAKQKGEFHKGDKDIARRLEHARNAVDSLNAAGLHDLAKEAAVRAEKLEIELTQSRADQVQKQAGGKHDDSIDGLRKEIEQLRQELKLIRELVKPTEL